MKTLYALLFVLLPSAFIGITGTAQATEWILDPSHTAAQFSVKHLMVSTVRGQFQTVSGTITIDDKDITRSTLDVTIDANSINTREPKRDAHLRSPDFFDVTKFPTLTFKSTKVEKSDAKLLVTGDLTIRGISKPITLTVEGPTGPQKDPWGNTARGVTATGKLNRKDFGLNWNKALEAGGVLVGDEVQLVIDAELRLKK